MAEIDKKIISLEQTIVSAKQSRDNETKSSMGDKYETGRAIIQFELEKNIIQLNKTRKLKAELLKIDLHKKYKKVEFGSLVATDKDTYFISIGTGKIKTNNNNYYCISQASPMGRTLFNKKEGDYFKFNGMDFIINNIQ